ncbi:cytochrome P450 [Nocardia sp. NPDC049220]|uniref:cytochrome P450 n=1 Tax=Nocardia sp. NPDC049220 TaxID=3155273 RepID=UPI0034093BB0
MPELTDQVTTTLIATVDATAAAMVWAPHSLTDMPDIVEPVRRGVDTVLSGRTPTAADRPAWELTRRVVAQTLRLYPPTWFLIRVTTVATESAGQHISVGITLVGSPCLIHHRGDPRPDPERFDPGRHGGPPHRAVMLPLRGGVPFSPSAATWP